MNVHVYNTTQKLTFMGKNFVAFIDSHLEPFFLKKIENQKQDIQRYNNKVIEVFQKVPPKQPVKRTVRSKIIKGYQCKRCDVYCTNNTSLQRHKRTYHTKLSEEFYEI